MTGAAHLGVSPSFRNLAILRCHCGWLKGIIR